MQQMADVDEVPDKAIRQRAIDYIHNNWGNLGDLPAPLIPVIWVTVYQSIRIRMKVEAGKSPRGLVKNTLIGNRQLVPSLEQTTVSLKFLHKLIPLIRSTPTRTERLAAAHLAVDILKWGIMDAPRLSDLRRAIIRQFAKADPEYEKPTPPEIS
jgi:hypothetical protein